ncbi:MAG TPA: pyridoxal-dependent decarboxylase, partial [Bryobacteraceae bacterium]|nr:pyridoxal-dependent decarboxylase [Bryobacteraceae bacterium]
MKTDLLAETAARAARYVAAVNDRMVAPSSEDLEHLDSLGGELQDEPCDPSRVIALLDEYGSPATVASTGARYFGFVTGGALPAAMAANWLAGAWDQNAALFAQSPVASKIEEIASRWLLDVLALPESSGVGFVTGATMANFTALAAARHALLARVGWNVEERGLFGAPEITVVAGEQVHLSMLKA